jgi:hypothetical protein
VPTGAVLVIIGYGAIWVLDSWRRRGIEVLFVDLQRTASDLETFSGWIVLIGVLIMLIGIVIPRGEPMEVRIGVAILRVVTVLMALPVGLWLFVGLFFIGSHRYQIVEVPGWSETVVLEEGLGLGEIPMRILVVDGIFVTTLERFIVQDRLIDGSGFELEAHGNCATLRYNNTADFESVGFAMEQVFCRPVMMNP